MTPVKPWARGVLELLQHAEEHRLGSRDFDRRVALIGFDNAIESSVSTYLALNPVQRGGRAFPKSDTERWLANFHSKVEFLEHFANSQQKVMPIGRPEIIYYHSLRNDLYHNGNGVVPASEHVDGARQAALWTFSTLFECDSEALLGHRGNREPQPIKGTQLSAPTAFLESYIKMKNELRALLAAMNKTSEEAVGLDRLLHLFQHDLDVPASVVQATMEAEKTKELVIQGDQERIDEATVRSLTSELGTVAEYLQQRLRSYQLEIVDAAVTSTLAAARSDGRAGIVVQVTGSGVSITLLAYLARCRQTKELIDLPYIVLVDRVELGHGLIERLGTFDAPEQLATVMPNSALELERILEAPVGRTIVTSWQMLRMIGAEQRHAFSCLVICFNQVQMGTANVDLKSIFPRGNFILFGSTRHPDAERLELFGNLIRTYDFPAAVVDGFMLPVYVEQHSIAPSESDIARENPGMARGLPADRVRGIASALLKNFRDKMSSGIHQGVLVTKSRASMGVFASELNALLNEPEYRNGADELIVVELGSGDRAYSLYNDPSRPILWLSTVDRLVGRDLGPGVACFVACKISQGAQHRLFSLVARSGGTAKEAFIVDYADNHWDMTLEVNVNSECRRS